MEDLPFTVELWSGDRLETVLARCSNPLIGGAAYRQAVADYGQRQTVMLCHRARIVARSDRE